MRERDYLTRTRKSPTVRIKINFSANAKCQSRARRREKSPAFFDHCTPDDNSALAIWKIPGISCFRIPLFSSLGWHLRQFLHARFTIDDDGDHLQSMRGVKYRSEFAVYSSGKSLFKRIKSNRADLYLLFSGGKVLLKMHDDAGEEGRTPSYL